MFSNKNIGAIFECNNKKYIINSIIKDVYCSELACVSPSVYIKSSQEVRFPDDVLRKQALQSSHSVTHYYTDTNCNNIVLLRKHETVHSNSQSDGEDEEEETKERDASLQNVPLQNAPLQNGAMCRKELKISTFNRSFFNTFEGRIPNVLFISTNHLFFEGNGAKGEQCKSVYEDSRLQSMRDMKQFARTILENLMFFKVLHMYNIHLTEILNPTASRDPDAPFFVALLIKDGSCHRELALDMAYNSFQDLSRHVAESLLTQNRKRKRSESTKMELFPCEKAEFSLQKITPDVPCFLPID